MGRTPAPHESPKAPRDLSWDWSDSRSFGEILEQAGWDGAVTAHAWLDPDEDPEHDPPQEKGAYKLPHHELIDGRLRVVWRGVVAAMAVINGARGGVDIHAAGSGAWCLPTRSPSGLSSNGDVAPEQSYLGVPLIHAMNTSSSERDGRYASGPRRSISSSAGSGATSSLSVCRSAGNVP